MDAMRNLLFSDRIIVIFTIVFALLLGSSYALPYIFPQQFPLLSVWSLTLPIFLIINLLLGLYWLARLKKYGIISLLVLSLGHHHLMAFYKFFGNDTIEKSPENMLIMTYNVRLFNAYRWIDKDAIADDIITLIRSVSPDVLCIQEFSLERENAFDTYPYHYIENRKPHQKNGQAIFSMFPIVNKGSLAFPHTSNSAIYVDVIKQNDTIRIYNLHLESLKIHPKNNLFNQGNSEYMYKRIAYAFAIQQRQVEIFEAHAQECNYKKILCGDFNNTPYSNTYMRLKKNRKDSFEEAGIGFGRTFNFDFFPIRIDFILIDKDIEVLAHKNYTEKYSDHFPVIASLRF